jgi:P27 family predicted phage terminase small subunit
MGNKNSGPRRVPTPIKKLRGTFREDRSNPKEPIPPPAPESFDTPPKELHGDQVAIDEWSRVVPMLRRIGLVSETERAALISLCQQWSRYLDAHNQIRTGGMVVDADKGPIVSPYIAVADKALTHCQKLWVELGLTPSGRSRMTSLLDTEPAKVSKWAGLA